MIRVSTVDISSKFFMSFVTLSVISVWISCVFSTNEATRFVFICWYSLMSVSSLVCILSHSLWRGLAQKSSAICPVAGRSSVVLKGGGGSEEVNVLGVR